MRVKVFGIFPAVIDEDDELVMEKHWLNDHFEWLFNIIATVNAFAYEIQGLEPQFWVTTKK